MPACSLPWPPSISKHRWRRVFHLDLNNDHSLIYHRTIVLRLELFLEARCRIRRRLFLLFFVLPTKQHLKRITLCFGTSGLGASKVTNRSFASFSARSLTFSIRSALTIRTAVSTRVAHHRLHITTYITDFCEFSSFYFNKRRANQSSQVCAQFPFYQRQ